MQTIRGNKVSSVSPHAGAPGEVTSLSGRNFSYHSEAEQRREIAARGGSITYFNNGHHWIIRKGLQRIDYWPKKQKFQLNGGGIQRGLGLVLEILEQV